MEEITGDDNEKLCKYRKLRSSTKSQITRIKNWLTTVTELTDDEIRMKTDRILKYSDKLQLIQDNIDTLSDDPKEEEERYLFEEELDALILELNRKKIINSYTDEVHEPTHQITGIPNLNFIPYQENENMKNFVRRFDNFMSLRGSVKAEMKVRYLMNALPPNIHQKVYDLCAPENPLEKTYENLINILYEYLDPQPSVWAQQHKFISRMQQPGESVTEFHCELKKISADCEFLCECGKSVADMFLKLQFIRGLQDSEIRNKLIQNRNKRQSFKEVVDNATILELSKTESKLITNSQLETNTFQLRRTNQKEIKMSKNIQSLKGRCYRCGSEQHRAKTCSFKNTTCTKCRIVGHLAKVCLSKGKPKKDTYFVDDEENEINLQEINIISSRNTDKFLLNIVIEGKPLKMELDTGAALSSMSQEQFLSLGLGKKLFKTGVELRTYTGEIIKPKGVAYVNCHYKDQVFHGKLFIINGKVDAIFGREWMREVKLDWADIKQVATHNLSLEKLLKSYEDVFRKELGVITNTKGHFRLIEGATPVFCKPRQVPFSLKERINKELDRLESCKVISKVDHSAWGTPIVPVLKPSGEVRLCADYKTTLNKFIQDEHYPIPRIEEIFAQMNGGKYFSTLDISQAYLHMEMDEESALMQTISTHRGLYRVNRLMFGVKVAPALWQRFMDKILQGIDGVQCFFDDIIIQGKTQDEALEKLQKVLQIIRTHNLRLNKDKCKFFQKQIEYLGHTIDENGLHKSKRKTAALAETRQPRNVSELRTFLGLANYYNRFIPNLATLLNPIYKLLQRGEKYIWSEACEKSFQKVKLEICSDKVLAHFDPSLPLILATDASPVGLGAVLSHRYKDGTERPIAFASRSLTKCELNYSQIDKEATGIYWGLKKFLPYCYGRKFIIITDHKPLVSIFHPAKTLPTMSAMRIFNYAHFLSGFDYTIEYRGTKEHNNADFFSRFPMENGRSNVIDDYSRFQIQQINVLPLQKGEIAEETKRDQYLRPLLDALLKGDSVEPFGLHDHEIGLQDGCLFKGQRVMIPATLQKRVLQELHTGHLGIVKMKALARAHCYWKNIDQHIENVTKSCRSCCLNRNNPPKVEIHPWQEASGPWQRIHMDFAEYNGSNYFIVVDAFTKWVEVFPTRLTTTKWFTQKLKSLFTTFGLPDVLVTDNGPQFTSREFEEFLKNHGIVHKRTAPYHPASNGQAERFVQTVKKSIKAMSSEGGDEDYKISCLLMQLRGVINSTGSSSYELMFGRQIRTKLSLLNERKETIKNPIHLKFNKNLQIGERVQVRNYRPTNEKWKFGTIMKIEGNLIYVIKLDNGEICRRHANQILATKIRGEN